MATGYFWGGLSGGREGRESRRKGESVVKLPRGTVNAVARRDLTVFEQENFLLSLPLQNEIEKELVEE